MLLVVCFGNVHSEQLADPTRPADATGAAREGSSGPSGPALQSVLISPHRRIAIVNGKTLKLGDKVGKARLVSITETEVVLQNGKDRQILKLYPDIQKRGTSHVIGDHADHRR
jgi:MSHA biogenesis protein MshK